jgi:hypothetical protein
VIYFGQNERAPNGFYFPTDDFYSEKTPDYKTDRFNPNTEDEDLRNKSGASFENAWQKMKTSLAFGSLIGLSDNPAKDFDETRMVYPGKIGVSLLTTGDVEANNFGDRKTFPVIFGRLERTRNKALDLRTILPGLYGNGPDKQEYKYTISCVEIFEPEILPFLDPENEFPIPE